MIDDDDGDDDDSEDDDVSDDYDDDGDDPDTSVSRNHILCNPQHQDWT